MGVCGRAATRRPAPSGASPIGFSHHPSRPANGQPIVAGWLSHWVAQVRLTSESWTAPRSIVRVPPGANLNEVAVAQIQRVLARRPADDRRPLCVFDAGGGGAGRPPARRARGAGGSPPPARPEVHLRRARDVVGAGCGAYSYGAY